MTSFILSWFPCLGELISVSSDTCAQNRVCPSSSSQPDRSEPLITKLPPISSDTWSMNRSCRTEEDEQTAVHLTNSRSLIHEYWNKTLHDWIILMNLCVHLLLQITDSWVLEQNTAELNHSHESLCSPASPDHWFMSTGTKHCTTESFSWIFVFTCFSRSLIHEYWNKTLHNWIILMNLCVRLLLQITDSWVLEQNTAELNHSHESLCSPASPDHWFMSTGTKHCRTESFSWIFVFACFSRSLIHEYWNKTLQNWIILMNLFNTFHLLCVHLLLQITDSWVLEQNTARLNHSHESLCSPASPDHWFMSTGTKTLHNWIILMNLVFACFSRSLIHEYWNKNTARTESFSWIFVFTCFSRSLIHEYWNKTLHDWIILMNLCVHLLLQITDSWVLEQNTAQLNHSHESLCSPASPDHWFMSTGTKHSRTESFSWIFVFACFSRSLIHEYWNKTLHDWIILMNLCVHLLLQITDSWVLEQNTAELNHSHGVFVVACFSRSLIHEYLEPKQQQTESFSWIFVFACFSRSLIHEYWNKTQQKLNHSHESLCSPASPDHWFMSTGTKHCTTESFSWVFVFTLLLQITDSWVLEQTLHNWIILMNLCFACFSRSLIMSTGTKHCRTESFSWIFVFACFSRSLIHEYWNKTLHDWIILMNLCVRLLLQITESWVLEQNTAQLNHSHESFQHISPALCSPASPDHWFMSTGTKHCTTESFSWIFVFTCFSRSLIHEYWNKTLHDWIILMNLCVHLLLQITDSWVLEQNTAQLNHSHESFQHISPALCSPASPDHWFMSTGTKHCRTESFSWIFVFTCFSRSLIHEYWNKTLQNWIILMNLYVRLLLQITESWVLEQNTAELNHSHESLCSPASPDHWFMSTGTKHCTTESFSWIFVFTCFSRSLIHEYWNKTLHNWIILMNLCVHLLLQITDSWVLEQNTARLNHSHESLCSPASPDHWIMSTGTKHCRTESFSWIFVFACFSRSLIHEYWNKTLHNWIILMNLCVHLLLQITDSWVLEQNTARLNHSHESLCSPASPDHWFMSTGTKHCTTESFSWIFVFTCFSRSLIHEYWNKTLHDWIILMNLCVRLLLQITDSWVLEQNTARLNHSHESLCSPASPDHWFMSTGTKHCRTESFSWIFVFICFSRSLIHEYWNKTLQNWIILMNLCVHLLLQITDSWVLEQNTARLNHSHESFQHISPVLCSPASPDHCFYSDCHSVSTNTIRYNNNFSNIYYKMYWYI